MVDLHHIPNIKDAKRLIKNFIVDTGIVIALSPNAHRNIRSVRFANAKSARELLAMEILHLRRNSFIPVGILLKLVDINKQRYPDSFKK